MGSTGRRSKTLHEGASPDELVAMGAAVGRKPSAGACSHKGLCPCSSGTGLRVALALTISKGAAAGLVGVGSGWIIFVPRSGAPDVEDRGVCEAWDVDMDSEVLRSPLLLVCAPRLLVCAPRLPVRRLPAEAAAEAARMLLSATTICT